MPENRTIAGEKDLEGFFSPGEFARNNHLLIIAIDEYGGGIRPLSNAVRDAEAFANVLLERYRFEEDNVVRVYNGQATRAGILRTLKELVRKLTENDCLLIYYSGHGIYDNSLGKGYWVPADATAEDESLYIPNTDLADYLHAMKAHHIVLISDSCFSGSLFVEGRDVSAFAERVDSLPSRWGISSGRNETVSDGIKGKNSPFADQLLYFLEKNAKASLPVAELAQFVEVAVSQNATQTPMARPLQNVGDRGGQFIFRLRQDEEAAWQAALLRHTEAGYDDYLEKYPQGKYKADAYARMERIAVEADWQEAKRKSTLAAYRQFIDKHPQSAEADLAKQAIEDLKKKPDQGQKEAEKQRQKAEQDRLAKQRKAEEALREEELRKHIEKEKLEQHKPERPVINIQKQVYEPIGWQKPAQYAGLALLLLLSIWGGYRMIPTDEDKAWKQINQAEAQSIRKFLQVYPNSAHTEEATARIKQLEQDSMKQVSENDGNVGDKIISPEALSSDLDSKVWQEAQRKNTIAGYQDYLNNHAQGQYRTQAEQAIKDLQATKKDFEYEMVYVQGGTFTMGCTTEQGSDCESGEKPVHEVALSSYSIGKYEVTQAQWKEIMGNNPSKFSGCNQCPVEQVSWNDIQDFLKKLNAKTGKQYRLPTEAEWEFAARGGNSSKGYKHAGSNTIGSVAWSSENSNRKTHPVGQKSPNELGIYDMSGNVWEWCSDWYGGYASGSQINPKGPSSGFVHVERGGSWYASAKYCRITNRSIISSNSGSNDKGFRLALGS